nr:MAG TPA: hypothetical protein [Caudoviricetes sp.]
MIVLIFHLFYINFIQTFITLSFETRTDHIFIYFYKCKPFRELALLSTP